MKKISVVKPKLHHKRYEPYDERHGSSIVEPPNALDVLKLCG
jgi:hypothetical protein